MIAVSTPPKVSLRSETRNNVWALVAQCDRRRADASFLWP
jgi:hypothetical protein